MKKEIVIMDSVLPVSTDELESEARAEASINDESTDKDLKDLLDAEI